MYACQGEEDCAEGIGTSQGLFGGGGFGGPSMGFIFGGGGGAGPSWVRNPPTKPVSDSKIAPTTNPAATHNNATMTSMLALSVEPDSLTSESDMILSANRENLWH